MNIKERIASLGCIVCRQQKGIYTPAQFHHIHSKAKRRVGDRIGIPLCYVHHQSELCDEQYVSRHPWKKEFVTRYGSEESLYQATMALYNEQYQGSEPLSLSGL